ncbi:division initiation protein [Micromonospora sp. B006]|nr:division initiation protein [Micromonospora sp. B006]
MEPERPSGPAGEPDPRPDAPDPDELSPLAPVEPAPEEDPAEREAVPESEPEPGAVAQPSRARRFSSAGLMIAVLLALLGFTLVVQLKTTSTDPTLAATREEDLVRISSDLDSRERRLRQDIEALEESQRQLRSGEQGRQAALEEATRRADELGILAGTLPAVGPGLEVRFSGPEKAVSSTRILDAVQELRGAGAEAMQIQGADGSAVRVIASTYFVDGADGALVVDGRRLTGPFTIMVIGDPATMRTALNIPGGVVASVRDAGGNVTSEDREVVEVSQLHAPIKLDHARPVS